MTYFPHLSPKALDFFIMLESFPTWSPYGHCLSPFSAASAKSLQNLNQHALLMQDSDLSSKKVLSIFVAKLVEAPSFNDQPFVTLKQ